MSTREELTRQAEKCLRQGRLDEAIAHYQALADLAPVDWGVVKQLADLLERANQREGAAAQFCRWADHLFTEGFHSKSAALYKKVLKLEPAHEHALWRLAEVSLELKLKADARVALQRVVDLRQRRGDANGAALARERLAALEATPSPSPSGALAAIAPAAPVPAPAAALAAEPARATVAAPPVPPETDTARLARLRREAEAADAAGTPDVEVRWRAVLDADPQDVAVRLRLVQAACDRGDLDEADRLALPLDPSEDPALVALVDLAYRRGRTDAVHRLIAGRVQAGGTLPHVLSPVTALADRHQGAAQAALTAAVAAWTAAGQPGRAVAAFEQAQGQGLLTTALILQWVDICVDAGLPGLSRAQHALARACLAEGRGGEARAVAEDLFVREGGAEPWRALLIDILDNQGVADPHRVLVDLLTPPSEVADDVADAVVLEDVVVSLDALTEEWESLELTAVQPDASAEGIADTAIAADAPAVTSDAQSEVASMDEREFRVEEPERYVASPSLPPAIAEPRDFDWAFLLGREVEGAVPSAVVVPGDHEAQAAMPIEPAAGVAAPASSLDAAAIESPLDIVEIQSPVDVAALEPLVDLATIAPPASADVSVPLEPEAAACTAATADSEPPQASPADDAAPALPTPVDIDVAAPAAEEGASDAVVPDQPVAPTEPVVPDVRVVAAASRRQAWVADEGPVVGADVPILAADPADSSLFRAIGELQPKADSGPALPPSFSVPSSWRTSDEPAATFFGTSRPRHPDDAYLFEEEEAATPVAPPIADEPFEDAEPVTPLSPEAAQPSATDDAGRPAEPPSRGEEPEAVPDLVEEEVDLTQLLEELKLWDPELPDPRPRSGAELPTAIADASARVPAAQVSAPEAAPGQPSSPAHASDDPGDSETAASAAPVTTAGEGREDLDAVFADLQRHADGRSVAEQQLAAGRVFLAAGLVSEAARAFERASLEPRSRFGAAQALAELHRSRGQMHEAVSWYEQAAAAPVPDAAPKRAVLYDLAESLEALGETDRALGVLLDLLSQVEDYRDARARLDRLLRVDAGG